MNIFETKQIWVDKKGKRYVLASRPTVGLSNDYGLAPEDGSGMGIFCGEDGRSSNGTKLIFIEGEAKNKVKEVLKEGQRVIVRRIGVITPEFVSIVSGTIKELNVNGELGKDGKKKKWVSIVVDDKFAKDVNNSTDYSPNRAYIFTNKADLAYVLKKETQELTDLEFETPEATKTAD
jgi:hypothetical protein